MKRILILFFVFLLALSLLSCGNEQPPAVSEHPTAPAPSSSTPPPLEGSLPEIMSRPVEARSQLAEVSCELGRIALEIPEGFVWDIIPYDPEAASPQFGISFAPEGEAEPIRVCWQDSFGVCGTGLTEVPITLGGLPAQKGIYQGEGPWGFIVFDEPYSHYVVTAFTAGWLADYEEPVNEVLDSLVLG